MFLGSRAPVARLGLACAISLCFGVGCGGEKKAKPRGAAPSAPGSLPAIKITRDRQLLFTYRVGPQRFETVERIDQVPATARGWVRVQDPSVPLKAGDLVYVADLRRAQKNGEFPYLILSRTQFATGQAAPRPGTPGGGGVPPVHAAIGKVILYSRPGCGACVRARQYLSARRVQFVEKDVSADPTAAKELQTKADKQGFPKNVVPVIDVRGTIVVGLNIRRLEQLLRRQI